MIDLEFVEKLIHTLDASGIDHVEIERGGTRIRISKTPPPGSGQPVLSQAAGQPSAPSPAHNSPAPTAEAPAEEAGAEAEAGGEDLLEITSPMVGTFYRAPAPDADSFVEVGQRISQGDTLCIIEAMKLMNELEAEVEGTIREVCVENAEPVEYGQVLFRVDPA